jgi:molecular chaperone DnaK
MHQVRSAIVFFSEKTGVSPLLKNALQQMGIKLLLPHHLSKNGDSVSLIIIERPAEYALKICDNLRKTKDFAHVPIIVILESSNKADSSKFTEFQADVLLQPLTVFDLQRHLKEKLTVARKVFETAADPVASPPPVSSAPPETGAGKVVTAGSKPSGLESKSPAQNKGHAGNTVAKEESKVVTTPNDLKDDIPSSPRLLPVTTKPVTAAKDNGVRCMRCQRWQARREDAFCSRCGEPLIALELSPEVITFEPLGNQKIGKLIELRNTGQNPLRITFNLQDDQQLAKRFSLRAPEAVLDGQSVEDQLIILDAHGLDLTTSHEALLEINTNERGYRRRQVKLVVESLAKPRVIAEPTYIYALQIENQTWDFKLANDGGGTLKLEHVRLDISKDNIEGFSLESREPVTVKGGQAVPVHLAVPALSLNKGKYPTTLSWKFKDYKPSTVNVTIEVIQPPKLNVHPQELDFGVVSTRRSKTLILELNNSGGENLHITSIDLPGKWMRIESEQPPPYVLAPGTSQIVRLTVIGADELEGDYYESLTIHSNSFESSELHVPLSLQFVIPKDYDSYIGMDFGTTGSCVAVLSDGEPSLIPLDSNEGNSQANQFIMPSVLYFQENGKVLTGWDALMESGYDSTNAVTSVKRALGLKQNQTLAGREYSPTELTAKIIEELIVRTEDGLFKRNEYKTPRRAVVTIPVGLMDQQKHKALLDACEMAGLETFRSAKHGMLINEAHAVALHYLNKMKGRRAGGDKAEQLPLVDNDREIVLIFDFGGGTLDCELIEIERSQKKTTLRILAPGGDPRLGGEDIDWALAKLLAAKAKEQYPEFDENCVIDENLKRRYRYVKGVYSRAINSRAAFKREAERAKIQLSTAAVAEVKIHPLLRKGATYDQPYLRDQAKDTHFEVKIHQAEFEQVLKPFLDRAVSAVEDVCHWAGVELKDVRTILHAGRSSRIPQVKAEIKKLLENADDRSELIEPKVCVALGAAFWGKIKDRLSANFEVIGSPIQRMYDIGYKDVDAYTYDDVFVPIFYARTEPPTEKTIEIPRAGRDVYELPLVISRGRANNVARKWKEIGKVRIIAHGTTDETISVCFRLNVDGIIEVVYNDQTQIFEFED